jgi:hypothetical protein
VQLSLTPKLLELRPSPGQRNDPLRHDASVFVSYLVSYPLPASHRPETGTGRIDKWTQKDTPRKARKQIGKALEAIRQVESVAWRVANKNAGASETGEEKRCPRTAADFTQAIARAKLQE